jgi:hypothetical protein
MGGTDFPLSCAGLTRASMMNRRTGQPYGYCRGAASWIARVKPGNDN